MIMVTHDLDDLAALAEHVFVMDDGCVVRDIDLRATGRRDAGLQSLVPEPPSAGQRARREALAEALSDI